jgi:hypothetical protein
LSKLQINRHLERFSQHHGFKPRSIDLALFVDDLKVDFIQHHEPQALVEFSQTDWELSRQLSRARKEET